MEQYIQPEDAAGQIRELNKILEKSYIKSVQDASVQDARNTLKYH